MTSVNVTEKMDAWTQKTVTEASNVMNNVIENILNVTENMLNNVTSNVLNNVTSNVLSNVTSNILNVTDNVINNVTDNVISNVTGNLMVIPEGCKELKTQMFAFLPWNNPRNIISQHTEVMTDVVVSAVLLPLMFLVSGSTNIVNMIVFYKQGLKERINLCLFFQSFADCAYMLINFLTFADRPYTESVGMHRHQALLRFILNNYLTGFYGLSWASGFMTMLIAVERCFCVVSPLKAQRLFKTKTTLVVILVAFVLIVGGFFIIGTTWYLECVYDPATGKSWLELYTSPFYRQHRTFIDALYGYVYGVVLPFPFFVTVVVATVITVVRLHKFSSWREKSASTSGTVTSAARDLSVTRMLVGCSVLFVACNLLGVSFRISLLFVPDLSLQGHYRNLFSFLVTLSKLCNYVNSTCNFFIYYAMGTRYKKTLKEMCCCCCGNTKKKGRGKGNFSGEISTGKGNFSGEIPVGKGKFSGETSKGNFSGETSVGKGNFSGEASIGKRNFSGELSVGNGNFSGDISRDSGFTAGVSEISSQVGICVVDENFNENFERERGGTVNLAFTEL